MTTPWIAFTVIGVLLYLAAVVACIVRYAQTRNKQFLLLLALLLAGFLGGLAAALLSV
jgi:hypothetical protein